MKIIGLYSDSSRSTFIEFFQSGQVLICCEQKAGTYLLRVSKEDKQNLLQALFEACNHARKTYCLGFVTRRFKLRFPEYPTEDNINNLMIICIKNLFLNRLEDPFDEIKAFLFKNEIKFGSEYWSSR